MTSVWESAWILHGFLQEYRRVPGSGSINITKVENIGVTSHNVYLRDAPLDYILITYNNCLPVLHERARATVSSEVTEKTTVVVSPASARSYKIKSHGASVCAYRARVPLLQSVRSRDMWNHSSSGLLPRCDCSSRLRYHHFLAVEQELLYCVYDSPRLWN